MTDAPELILHIGHYKTGTTALQTFFVNNYERLAEAGLRYAEAPLHNLKHSELAFCLLRDAGVTQLMHGYKSPVPSQDHWQRLFAATRALPPGQSMLVSSEEFIRLGAHPDAAAALRAQIDSARDLRFRVIVYLRRPQEHLLSWYNQMVKSGQEEAGFDAAILSRTEPVHWDYALALQPWIDIFGPEALILRPFDPSLRQGDALYRDFLGALGHPLPAGAGTAIADPNPRLDDRLLALRRGITRAGVKPGISASFLTEAERSLQAADPAPPRDFAALRAEAEAGLDRIATLPGAAPGLEHLRDALPRAQDPADRRLDDMIALLSAELIRLRARLAAQANRIRVLEGRLGAQGTPGTETDADA